MKTKPTNTGAFFGKESLKRQCIASVLEEKGKVLASTVAPLGDKAAYEIYEEKLGIPAEVGVIESVICFHLAAESWPSRFLQTVQVGADLTAVPWKFFRWLLTGLDYCDKIFLVEGAQKIAIALDRIERHDATQQDLAAMMDLHEERSNAIKNFQDGFPDFALNQEYYTDLVIRDLAYATAESIEQTGFTLEIMEALSSAMEHYAYHPELAKELWEGMAETFLRLILEQREYE